VLFQDDGTRINRGRLRYALKIAQRRVNMVQDGRVHILRHIFCSRLAGRGAPFMTIKELAGPSHWKRPSATCTSRWLLHVEGIRALERGTTRRQTTPAS
jgi:hypothetical protein